MLAQNKITDDAAEKAREELKRRVVGGRLRRGNEVYARFEYRPYRDLALREARASGSDLAADYRLVVYIDAEFQSRLAAQICVIAGKHQSAGVFMRPSGEVLAVSGSCTYSGEWNRADRHRPLDRIDRQAIPADRRARSLDEHARARLDPPVAETGLAVRGQ